MAPSGAVFLFGKLPAHGDFVARGVSESARQAWDDWASAALEQLHASADDFETAHDAAPAWRFIAGPSAMADGWCCGALAPSIDSAGRRFIVAAGVSGLDPQQAAVRGAALAELTETLIYRALSEGMTADDAVQALQADLGLTTELAEAAMALSAEPAGPGAWWSTGSGLSARAAAQPPADLLAAACAFDSRSPAA